MKYLLIALRVIVSVILLQTLFFKFTGAEESIYIFSTMGMEPWGRYLTGIIELIAGVMLLLPRYYHIGAVASLGVISGAVFSHLTVLGIEVMGDGGYLFFLALVVMISSLFIIIYEKDKLLKLIGYNED
ncbi:MAG: DoxX family protein [Cyclobacteriaceae bacterium]